MTKSDTTLMMLLHVIVKSLSNRPYLMNSVAVVKPFTSYSDHSMVNFQFVLSVLEYRPRG